jgi:serine/threonine-protein kinase
VRIGQTVSRFTIVSKIGLGGGGEVFLARDTSLDRQVAIKLLGEQEDHRSRQRFLAEAKATAAIDHPFVCKVYEVGEADKRPYIAMEYVEGETLKDTLIAGSLPVEHRLRITREIAEALGAAHAKGIIHRDLKPANIMLTPDGHVKVLDFGVAKQMPVGDLLTDDGITKTGMILGTPAYMSPEQTESRPLDPRSDIFSFGTIAYEMFTGIHPFRRGVPIKTMMAVLNEPVEPVSRHWPECPDALEQIIERMLAKELAQRYQSVRDVYDDLCSLTPSSIAAVTTMPARPPIWSIAVLPFVNMGPKDNEYFSDGITEELILQLSKIKGLKVVSLTSAMHFKGSTLDPESIGKRLSVNTIVEGSVRWAGNRVRISGKLTDLSSGMQIWADAFNRQVDDVFGVQEEVAQQIAIVLEKSLTLDKLTSQPATPQSFAAYQAYLKGRYFLNKLSLEDLQKAIGYFQSALDEDPIYARAYSGISISYAYAGHFNYLPIPEAYPKARAAAQKALELDDSIAEAHSAMALIKLFLDWDLEGAEIEFKRTMALNPNYSEARQFYSWFLVAAGRLDEAAVEARRAVEIDPLSFLASLGLGWVLMTARQYEAAEQEWRKTLDLVPGFVPALLFLAHLKALQGCSEEAIAVYEEHSLLRSELAQIYAMTGQHERALDLLESIEPHTEPAWEIAVAYIMADELDKGLEWLEESFRQRDVKLVFMQNMPALERYHTHPRMVEFYQRIGLEARPETPFVARPARKS